MKRNKRSFVAVFRTARGVALLLFMTVAFLTLMNLFTVQHSWNNRHTADTDTTGSQTSDLKSLDSFTQQKRTSSGTHPSRLNQQRTSITNQKDMQTDKNNGDNAKTDDDNDTDNDTDDEVKEFIPQINNDKSQVIAILAKAGVDLTESIYNDLPTWTEITSLYYKSSSSSPEQQKEHSTTILGLDTCDAYRKSVLPSHDIYIGPAGLFNTGTSLLDNGLHQYCHITKRTTVTLYDTDPHHKEKWKFGTLFQVPWGKHNPATMRLVHEAQVGSNDVEQSNVLPVVMMKDPYHWMQSMCRHPYEVHWPNQYSDHCPQLVSSDVQVPFANKKPTTYKSLVHFWNQWNGQYVHYDHGLMQDFPRLVVRYEDLLFHQEDVIQQVCECVGGTVVVDKSNNGMRLKETAAKPNHLEMHTGSSDLVSAIIRYGKNEGRVTGMTNEDIMFAESMLDDELMNMFGYTHPSTFKNNAAI